MSRFNKRTKGSNTTVNYEGAKAYKLSPEMELYTAVCTSTLSPQFYVPDTEKTLKRIRDLISKVSPTFVAKLAIYAREKMYLRSIPLVLTVELAKMGVSRQGLLSNLTYRVIQRADEITELLSYYVKANDRTGTKKLGKLSNQLKKGIARSFNKFDEYQLAKYNRGTEIRLRDALFLTHPKPKDKTQRELFRKLAEDRLEIPKTWETQLSEAGKSDTPATTKKDVWEDMIDSGKLGYMALLRNLRNILTADVDDDHIEKIFAQLSNRNNVIRSKQFPFRFLSAYRMIKNVDSFNTSKVLDALEIAMEHSAENIPMFVNERVVIASDVSASMRFPISERSVVKGYDIGLVLSMLLQHKCMNVITGVFGDYWKTMKLPKNNILSNIEQMDRIANIVGYATNGYKVIRDLRDRKIMADRIMIFTDCQMWDSTYSQSMRLYVTGSHIQNEWNKYKKINPDCKLYLFDLYGYGNVPLDIRKNDVYLISGWSNEIFTILNNIENGEKVLDEINRIEV